MPNTLPTHRPPVKTRGVSLVLAGACMVALAAGCDDTSPTTPGTSRFGQVGVIEMTLVAPLALESGRIEQQITWTSNGDWMLREEIFYRDVSGDASTRRLEGDRDVSAGVYAQWIAQINESPGLDLFDGVVDPELDPDCPPSRSRVTLRVTDDTRDRTMTWVRCAPGSLANLTPTGSGPDAAAGRVINATVLLRDYTIGQAFESVYRGSLPFATLIRGEDAAVVFAQPTVFETEAEYLAYWNAVSTEEAPLVDFENETVLLAAVGIRTEAGDSVEVRRVVPVEAGTLVEVVERIPGNFCSPASRLQAPYHLVVAPRVSEPIRFTELRVERVPCG